MEFLVQPRTSNAMSIEDSMTEWKEGQAPFYKVATIRIPQQVFDTPDQNKFCENQKNMFFCYFFTEINLYISLLKNVVN